MPTPAAHILETALALQRAPGERFRLRERALPPGVIHLIEVAAASPQATQSAAAEMGETEATLVEAARFYLEQVLFGDPDADAYRVLGLAPDAAPEAIRTHHRWLQRWLHPDRAQAGDASVFATRVNQAFAQLRTPESRHAYDVRLAESQLASVGAPLAPETVRQWEDEVEPSLHGRRSRWLLLAALAACAVLAVLVVRNPDRAAPWDPDDAGIAEAASDPGPAIEDSDLGVLGAALAVAPAPSLPAELPADLPVAAPAPAPAPDVATLPPPAPAAPTPVALALARPAAALPHDSAPRRSGVVARVSTVPASPAPGRVASPSSVPARTAPAPAAASSVPEAPAPAEAAVQPAPQPPAGMRPEDAALVAARLPLARQRVAQLADYLASQPRAVPLWDNVDAMTQTNALRTQLNARKGSRLELARPAWRMRPEQAVLNADYRCRSGDGSPCAGRLEVVLVWREGLWLVRDVSIGPAA